MNSSDQLKRLIAPNGTPKKGALARISERLGKSRDTVRRWMHGLGEPDTQSARAIGEMARDHALKLEPLKPGPAKGAQTWKMGRNGKRIHAVVL